jgi:DNA polymerase-4
VIDFSQAPENIRSRDLVEEGYEIKRRLREEIGCWMKCNVGISTNQFLAKMAASLHKPDGLDVLTSHNIREVFAGLELKDLTGIAWANEHRLNAVGIYTPLDMLDAGAENLHIAFKSICGEWWHKRLRGWEVDDVDYDLKSCGRQYVLESPRLTHQEKLARLHSLVEGVGAKLRHNGKAARGVRLYARTYAHTSWQAHELAPLPFYSNAAIWEIVQRLFAGVPANASMFAVT